MLAGTEWPLRHWTSGFRFTEPEDVSSPLSKSTRHLLVPEPRHYYNRHGQEINHFITPGKNRGNFAVCNFVFYISSSALFALSSEYVKFHSIPIQNVVLKLVEMCVFVILVWFLFLPTCSCAMNVFCCVKKIITTPQLQLLILVNQIRN